MQARKARASGRRPRSSGTLERGDADVRFVQLSPATFLFGQPHDDNEADDEEEILRVISAPASSAASVASFNHASAL